MGGAVIGAALIRRAPPHDETGRTADGVPDGDGFPVVQAIGG